MPKIVVDGKEIEAEAGRNLLKACLDNGIYIPHLCYMEELPSPPAGCRLCFVAVEGVKGPVPACTLTVDEGLKVVTDDPEVRRLQKSALRLLLSTHDVDCANCPANKQCALQDIAKFLKVGLKPKNLDQFLKTPEVDDSLPGLNYYPNRCVLCGRCVNLCRSKNENPFLVFAQRGIDTVVAYFGDSGAPCSECGQCARVCPVGALVPKAAQ